MNTVEQIAAEILRISHIEDQMQASLALLESDQINESEWQALKLIATQWGQQGYRGYQIDFYLKMQAIHAEEDLSYQIAQTFFDMQEFEKANQALTAIEDLSLNYYYALLAAKLNHVRGQSQQAIESLQSLIKEYPECYEAYEEIALIYLEFNYKDRAKFYFQTLLEYFVAELQWKRREWRLHLMHLIVESEWIDLEELNQLIQIEELALELPEEYYLLAFAYYQGSELEEAESFALKVLDLDSEYFEARFLLLEIYANLGFEAKFEKTLDETAIYLPPYEATVIDVLEIADQIGIYTESLLELLASYYEIEEDERIQYRIIRAHVVFWLNQSNPQRALEKMNQFYFEQIDYLTYLYGRILMDQGEEEAGVKAYQTALELGVDEFDLVYRMVDFYLSADRELDAKTLVQKYRSTSYYTNELDSLWQNWLKSQ